MPRIRRCRRGGVPAASAQPPSPSTSAKGSTPHREPLHLVVVEGDDGKTPAPPQIWRSRWAAASQPRHHQPAFAAVVLRHKQHRRQQHQRKGQQWPCQRGRGGNPPGWPATAPPAPAPHTAAGAAGEAQRVAPAVKSHGAGCVRQHHQPKAHQREHQDQNGRSMAGSRRSGRRRGAALRVVLFMAVPLPETLLYAGRGNISRSGVHKL